MDSSDIAFAGAAAQARMLADGELTAPGLLEIYLERIARLDSELRAYRVVLTDKARDEASAAQDRESSRRSSRSRSPACLARRSTAACRAGKAATAAVFFL